MVLRTRLAVGAVVLFIAIGAQCVTSHYHDARIRGDMQAKAEALKDEINRRFPTGTRRSDFGPFAASWTGWHATSGNDHYLSVGQIPSPVWYCGPWDVVVIVRFKDERLMDTAVNRIGLNCP